MFYHFKPALIDSVIARMGHKAGEDSLIRIPELILWSILAFLAVRALSTLIFDLLFRIRRGYEAPTLVRNIFSLLAFTGLFVLIFNKIYQEIDPALFSQRLRSLASLSVSRCRTLWGISSPVSHFTPTAPSRLGTLLSSARKSTAG